MNGYARLRRSKNAATAARRSLGSVAAKSLETIESDGGARTSSSDQIRAIEEGKGAQIRPSVRARRGCQRVRKRGENRGSRTHATRLAPSTLSVFSTLSDRSSSSTDNVVHTAFASAAVRYGTVVVLLGEGGGGREGSRRESEDRSRVRSIGSF